MEAELAQSQEVGPGQQRSALISSLSLFSLILLPSFLPPFPSLPLPLYTHPSFSLGLLPLPSCPPSAPSQLSSALLFDAVYAVVTAVQELNRSQEIGVKPLSCGSAQIWQHGTSLMNYLRMVRGVWGPAGGGWGTLCARPCTSRPPRDITVPDKTAICADPILCTLSHSCSLIPNAPLSTVWSWLSQPYLQPCLL